MTNQKLHILFITPAFPESESNSHSVVYFSNFIKAYKNKFPSHKISIISLQLPEVKKKYQWHGTEVYSIGTYGISKLKKLLAWKEVERLAKKINNKERINIIHSLWLKESAFIAKRIARKLHVYHLCTVMGMELKSKNKFLKLINLNKMHLVFVSKRHHNLHQNQLGKNTKSNIIPWGIDSKSIFTESKVKRKYDVVFVGFLNENKNLNLFVNIIQQLKSNNQEIKALVIGDFFNLDKWKQEIINQKLENQIHFKGLIPNDEVLDIRRVRSVAYLF